jgi:hypothetical protein
MHPTVSADEPKNQGRFLNSRTSNYQVGYIDNQGVAYFSKESLLEVGDLLKDVVTKNSYLVLEIESIYFKEHVQYFQVRLQKLNHVATLQRFSEESTTGTGRADNPAPITISEEIPVFFKEVSADSHATRDKFLVTGHSRMMIQALHNVLLNDRFVIGRHTFIVQAIDSLTWNRISIIRLIRES